MFIRTRENYREVFKSIVGPKPDLRIFVLTLFNILVGTYLERETCATSKTSAREKNGPKCIFTFAFFPKGDFPMKIHLPLSEYAWLKATWEAILVHFFCSGKSWKKHNYGSFER